ncbi:hypothetical protein ACVBEH_02695 [Roseateles sp. GG27B]
MLQTHKAILQPNGSLQFMDLPAKPASGPCHVLVTFTDNLVQAEQ